MREVDCCTLFLLSKPWLAHLPACLSAYQPAYLPAYLSTHLSADKPAYQPAYLSADQPAYLSSARLPAYLSADQPAYLSARPSDKQLLVGTVIFRHPVIS